MEQFELDAYKGLNDLYGVVNKSQLAKTVVGSPAGSRRDMSQDATGWGVENLSKYLLDNNGDPYGVLDQQSVSRFLDPINARKQTLATRDPYLNYGTETEPSQVFSEFTTPQLKAYLDRQRSDAMAAGNPNNDAMWLPTLNGSNVTWGQKNPPKGGLWKTITDGEWIGQAAMAAVGGMGLGSMLGAGAAGAGAGAGALEAGALAGAPGYGAALESSLAGLGGLGGLGGIDSSWGVNPQGAGNMDWIDELLKQTGEFGQSAATLEGGFNSALSNAPWWSSLPTNIQNIVQQVGNLPPGTSSAAKSLLGKVLGGEGTQQDLMSLLGTLGSTGLGIYGANQQSDALTQIANQARSDRAPFLNAATGWMNNPSSYYAGAPAQAAMKGVLSGLAVNGNPASNPTAMASATEAGLRNWQNAVTGFGNLGLAGQDSRNALLSDAASADRGVTTALSSGLGSLTTPTNDLQSLLKMLQQTGLA